MDDQVFRRDGLLLLEQYLGTLERYISVLRLSNSLHTALHSLYCEARRVYYILSEWMVLTTAEQKAYRARLDCLARYRFPRLSKVKI